MQNREPEHNRLFVRCGKSPRLSCLAVSAIAAWLSVSAELACGENVSRKALGIGDSILGNWEPYARVRLCDIVQLAQIPENGGSTTHTLDRLDAYLDGVEKWDLVLWNNGLHDLLVLNGQPQVPLTIYRSNLEVIGTKLLERAQTVVFLLTTRIIDSPIMTNASVNTYNAVAIDVMRKLDIPVYDLHAASLALPNLPDGIHFDGPANAILGEAVAGYVRAVH